MRYKKLIFLLLLFSLPLVLLSCNSFCLHSEMAPKVVPPTCTMQGYTVYSCTACEYEVKSDFVDEVVHDFAKSIIAPSCTSSGFTALTCINCGFSYNENYTQPTNHTLKEKVVAPTCEEAGYTEHICVNCDFTYTFDYISAITHNYESEIISPTCTEEGYTKQVCSLCASTLLTDYTSPLDHDYIKTYHPVTSLDDGHTENTCSRCAYTYRSDIVYKHLIFTGARTRNTEVLAKGVDVSSYNEHVSWSSLKAQGIDFAIIRAGSSISGVDTCFEINYKNAKSAGIELGAYFYIYAKSVDEIYAILDNLLPILDGKKFEYPIYFDMEPRYDGDDTLQALGKDLITEMCVTFITELQKHGYFGALYTNNDWLENYYHTETVSELFDIWYARYPNSDSPEWALEKYGANTGIWQYSQTGSFDGHTAAFDLNYAYKDYPSIIKKFHFNGY